MIRLLVLLFMMVSLSCFAQDKMVIEGMVTAFNQYPLDKVTVKAKKSKAETTTNEKGIYELPVETNDMLIFEANGFKKHSQRIREAKGRIKTNMIFLNREQDFQVAIGYGHISKSQLAYAVDHFRAENNGFSNFTSVYDLIQANFNVRLITENGRRQFLVRGISSINLDNGALLVVDGVIVPDLDFLTPVDVSSIEILKDASASIYGSRGANGVILIETKRGKN